MGKLALFTVSDNRDTRVKEWCLSSDIPASLLVFSAFGAMDVVCIALDKSAADYVESLYPLLGLARGFDSYRPGGWTRAYSCECANFTWKARPKSPHPLEPAVLTLARPIRTSDIEDADLSRCLSQCPFPSLRFATEGFYQNAVLTWAGYEAAYEHVIRHLRDLGCFTYSIPMLPMALVLSDARDVAIRGWIRFSATVAAHNATDIVAARRIVKILNAGDPHDRVSLKDIKFSHGIRDLILDHPVEVDLVKFKRRLWKGFGTKSPLKTTRTILCAQFRGGPDGIPREHAEELSTRHVGPASPFAVFDRAGGEDFTKKVEIARGWLKRQISALPRRPESGRSRAGKGGLPVRDRIAIIASHELEESRVRFTPTGGGDGRFDILLAFRDLSHEQWELQAFAEINFGINRFRLGEGIPHVLSGRVFVGKNRKPDEFSYPLPFDSLVKHAVNNFAEVFGSAQVLLVADHIGILPGRGNALRRYIEATWSQTDMEKVVVARLIAGEFLRGKIANGVLHEPPSMRWIRDIAGARDTVLRTLRNTADPNGTPTRSLWSEFERLSDFDLAARILLGTEVPFETFREPEKIMYVFALITCWIESIALGRWVADTWCEIFGRPTLFPAFVPASSDVVDGLSDRKFARSLLIRNPDFRALAEKAASLSEQEISALDKFLEARDQLQVALQSTAPDQPMPVASVLDRRDAARHLSDEEVKKTLTAVPWDVAIRFSNAEHELVSLRRARFDRSTVALTFAPLSELHRFQLVGDNGDLSDGGGEILAAWKAKTESSKGLLGIRLAVPRSGGGTVPEIRFPTVHLNYVGVQFGDAITGYTWTQLARRWHLEHLCLQGVQEVIQRLPLVDRKGNGALVSFNISSWLFDARYNPWLERGGRTEVASELLNLTAKICDRLHRKGYTPVVEIVEGEFPFGDGAPLRKFLEVLRSRHAKLGVAVDDQFTNKAGVDRLKSIADALGKQFDPFVVKIDSAVLFSTLRLTDSAPFCPDDQTGDFWKHAVTTLCHMARISVGAHDLGSLVFEGFSGPFRWGMELGDSPARKSRKKFQKEFLAALVAARMDPCSSLNASFPSRIYVQGD